MQEPRIGGITCLCSYPTAHGEPHTIEQRAEESNADFERRASDDGWRIGHNDGQGFYVGPGCEALVFDPVRIDG